jgi:hypothetical protein
MQGQIYRPTVRPTDPTTESSLKACKILIYNIIYTKCFNLNAEAFKIKQILQYMHEYTAYWRTPRASNP